MQQRGQDDDQQQPQDQPGQPAWQDPNQSEQGWQQPQFADQAPYGSQQPQWAQQPGQGPQQFGGQQFGGQQFGGQPQQTPYAGFQQPQPQAPKKNGGGKAVGFGCLGVMVIAAIVVVAVAVAGTKTGTSVNTTAAGSATSSAIAATTTGAAAPNKPAGLGATIDVTDTSGDSLAVTLVKVDAKATATDEFSSPDSGDQYYAAQFEIKDIGSTAWSDAPSNCTVVKDGKGQTFQSTIVESISSGPLMVTTANIAAGDSALGWIVFEVPKGDAVTTVQFTPDSGMADSTVQWSLS